MSPQPLHADFRRRPFISLIDCNGRLVSLATPDNNCSVRFFPNSITMPQSINPREHPTGQAGPNTAKAKAYEPILVCCLNFLMPAGVQRVVLPVFGDIYFAHRRAGIINNSQIPLRHSRCLVGVKEYKQEDH